MITPLYRIIKWFQDFMLGPYLIFALPIVRNACHLPWEPRSTVITVSL